jgi:hypothetical protein
MNHSGDDDDETRVADDTAHYWTLRTALRAYEPLESEKVAVWIHGPLYRFDVGKPSEAARATPLSLDQLNARLGLVGARAVPFEGAPPFGTERLWTVYVAESHVDAVHVLLAGLYGLSFGPDEMLSEELRPIDENEPTRKRLQQAVARRLAALGRGQDAQHARG